MMYIIALAFGTLLVVVGAILAVAALVENEMMPTLLGIVMVLFGLAVMLGFTTEDSSYEERQQACADRGQVYDNRLDACIEGSYLP